MADSVPSGKNVWEKLGLEIQKKPPSGLNLWNVLGERMDISRWRPKRIKGYELHRVSTSKGERYYILKNLKHKTYFKLTEKQVFIWKLLDGEHSVRDIALAYFNRYGAFAYDGIIAILSQLRANAFLEQQPFDIFNKINRWLSARTLSSRVGKLFKAFMRREFSLKNIDALIDKVYKYGGRFLYTRLAQGVLLIIALSGLLLFGLTLRQGKYSFLKFNRSYALGIILLLCLNNFRTLLHEGGHALTCKHFGREIRQAGVMIYIGSIVPFVDTTDIWLGSRSERILVSFAGPYSDILWGGMASLVLSLTPDWWGAQILFMFAALSYLSGIFNLNPLLEWDGYYILMDWLEIPCLRKRAFSFVRKELLSKVIKLQSFSREDIVFSIYGLLAGIYTAFIILMAIYLWHRRLAKPLAGFLGETGARLLISTLLVTLFLLAFGRRLLVLLPTRAWRRRCQ